MNQKVERIIALLTGVGIITFTMFLVARNEPFASSDLARMMRIILSLGIGVLGGTIPGFLNVSYNMAGFAVRAGGALALFVITFWGSPHVEALGLSEPVVEVSPAAQIDIRTRAAPDLADNLRAAETAVVTIPLHIRNVNNVGKSAFIERTEIIIPLGQSESTKFTWRYFVNMHEEAKGVWLGILQDAQPQQVPPGGAWNGEVLHFPATPLTWAQVLHYFDEQDSEKGFATISVYYSNSERTSSPNFKEYVTKIDCNFDIEKWRQELQKFQEATGRMPSRVTMECLEAET
jgi:hypothetical protein